MRNSYGAKKKMYLKNKNGNFQRKELNDILTNKYYA